jgi:hypothetical protein
MKNVVMVFSLPLQQMEKDVSVRQQAVDLLYAMCDKSNAEEIVQEMLNYLETADYSIREEMVRNDLVAVKLNKVTASVV